jgi:hypothetical protein
MIHLKITPDSRLENKNAERLPQTLFNFRNMLERWNGKGFAPKPFFSYEIVLQQNETAFYLTVPEESEAVARKAVESVWSAAAIDKVDDAFKESPVLTNKIEFQSHYMFALKIDRRKTNGALESLLETLNSMNKEDKVYIQVLCVPASRDWYNGAVEAYKKFKDGSMPNKVHFNKQGFSRFALKATTKTVLGVIDGVVMLTGGKPEPIDLDSAERASILKDGALRRETLQKPKGEAFEVYIRTAVVCKDKERSAALSRMVSTSFRDLDGDNQLISFETNPEKTFELMKERKSGFQIQKDYMSIPEVAQLVAMPSGALQEDFHIPHIGKLEIDVPDQLTKGGLLLGYHERKGKKQNVYFPNNNHDEICLPCAVIAGMGQGKTKGFGANKIVQAVKNGFGGLCIDPAKGELGNEIAAALPPEKIIRINLGKTPIAIDWRETKHAVRGRNRLANTIISFFGSDDTGGQTTRFLRASVFGMQTSNLKELLVMFEDGDYLKKCVKLMPDGIHKATLNNLIEYGDGRRRQVLDPLYNRLDDIIGDEYLSECFDAENGLDMVELMSERKAIIIDVPQSLVGETGVNLIGNLIMTKINLAMTLRAEENQFPFMVVIDEPHQFSRSQTVWKSACVESRKWRVGYNFLFHEWVQLDRDLRDIIKAAGVNYFLYPSSKKTFQNLAEEIAPFTLEDALKMPSHHAINIIRSGGEQIKPFILRMTPPPSMQ